LKVLVVDDEIDVKHLFEQKFRKEIKEGLINLIFAFNAEEALDYLNKEGHEAVLILSDINMPGMSGLDLLKEIRSKELNPVPVIMMITAYGDEENFNTAKKLGANDFLTKPLDFTLLKEKLKILA
jgi:two-component system, chemotaxis family, chemotaxis protein CheY